jgi:cytochrome c oxidase assembly protein subunit 15
LGGYLLFAAAWAFLAWTVARGGARSSVAAAGLLAAAVTGQMLLGVATLIMAAPVGLGILHQAGAVSTFAVAAVLAWTAGRAPEPDEVLAKGWTGRRGSAKGAADAVLGAAT